MIDTPTNEPKPEHNQYPVYPPDDGTDRPRNPYGEHIVA